MNRLKFLGQLACKWSGVNSVLDVGCRECGLKSWLPQGMAYSGNDLYQNKHGTVRYVGDISKMELVERFDLVVALDILEHVEQPSMVFDKLINLSNKVLIISLPNCYDLKSRVKFMFGGRLGGKYEFLSKTIEDRHRWVMSRPEIYEFYRDKARQHGVAGLSINDMKYGDPGGSGMSRARALARVLPSNLSTESVFGVFQK